MQKPRLVRPGLALATVAIVGALASSGCLGRVATGRCPRHMHRHQLRGDAAKLLTGVSEHRR